MKTQKINDIKKAVIKGLTPHLTIDAVADEYECPVYVKPTTDPKGHTIHVMPGVEFEIDATLDFWPSHAAISFNVRFLGCEWNDEEQEWDWGGSDAVIDMNFDNVGAPNIPKPVWFDEPITFGGRRLGGADSEINWYYQGVEGLQDKKNKKLGSEVLEAVIATLDKDARQSFLFAIFDKAKHSVNAPETTM